MPIQFNASEGYEFDESFVKELPKVEKTMIDNDIDPSLFVITKGPSSKYSSYQGAGRYFDYTVDTGKDVFTVTYANDEGLLEFLLDACTSKDDPAA
jgi:hypothetical protein